MDSRGDLFDGLARILQQEKRLGFQDRAVFGGLERFLDRWAERVRAEAKGAAFASGASAAIAPLSSYSTLDTIARENAVETALRSLTSLRTAGSMERKGERREEVGGPGVGRAGSETIRATGASRPSLRAASGVSPSPSPSPSPRGRGNSASPSPSGRANLASPQSRTDSRVRGVLTVDSSVRAQPGVGVSYGAKLERLGVQTIKELLYLFPRRHVDYSVMKRIKDLSVGQMESVLGTIWEIKASRAKSGLPVITATVADETGTIQVLWFNQPHLVKTLAAGRQVVLSGRIEENLGRPLLKSPDWELPDAEDLTHTGRLVPVYPLTEGIGQRWLRSLIKRILDRWVPELEEHLPKHVRDDANLLGLHDAMAQIHFPDSLQLLERAQERLVFDELFALQLGMLMKKRKWQESQPGSAFEIDRGVLDRFFASLPFELTGAQRRVIDETMGDLQTNRPMMRLLQGEVGSGKTVVATAAMIAAWSSGFQSVLMAPTEILAEQHYQTVGRLVESISHDGPGGTDDVHPNVRLLKGNSKKAEKEDVSRATADGEIDILIGTHAVIQDSVRFQRLGLVIVDEQHRFGVMQRTLLRQKGFNPHVLVMTATPIPRTLALSLYGDLDISAIDELPPGRQEIKTALVGPALRQRAYDFVRQHVRKGRQAFIICPLIEESDRIEAKAATAEYERLRTRVFPDLKLGLLHGKMRAQEKDSAMEDFRQGKTDVLVSTPVVEVGIDVPNATVMLIEGADRFGLAQLHQFRGRVGRGTEKSYCLLLADSPSLEAEERLQVVAQTRDGFALAEEDLRLRGPGEFFGTRQSGMPDFRIAKLGDVAALQHARAVANDLFKRDPGLAQPEHRLLAQQVARFWQVEGELN